MPWCLDALTHAYAHPATALANIRGEAGPLTAPESPTTRRHSEATTVVKSPAATAATVQHANRRQTDEAPKKPIHADGTANTHTFRSASSPIATQFDQWSNAVQPASLSARQGTRALELMRKATDALFGACPPELVRGVMMNEKLRDATLETAFVKWQKRRCVASLKHKWFALLFVGSFILIWKIYEAYLVFPQLLPLV